MKTSAPADAATAGGSAPQLDEAKTCIFARTTSPRLGRRGEDSLRVEPEVDDPTLLKLQTRDGERIARLAPRDGVAYAIRGGVQAGVEARGPSIAWTTIA